MNAPLRIVRTDRDGIAQQTSGDADDTTAQNLKQALRLFQRGFIAGWVRSHEASGPVAFDLEQRLKWDERNRALAEAEYDAIYGRAGL